MDLFEKHLVVKKSSLPRAGKGLFTKVDIPKDSLIVEYKGKITTWKEVEHHNGTNGYIFYVTRNHVVDAEKTKKALARYANDARGFVRVKGIQNNAIYAIKKGKPYIQSTKKISAGSEIFVEYGKEYWDTMKENRDI
ncbi:MAG: SET domain-containing protein [Ferruginibacter sp.]|nr:SET domain-containing protein [Ferruginibacter sp.]